VRAVIATRCASARSSCSTVSLRPFLDVPDHLGLEQIALGAQQRRLADREIERAQHVETFMGLAQIRMRFLDDGAGSAKRAAALRVMAATSGSTGVMPRSGE
jgi:hypothetical protein